MTFVLMDGHKHQCRLGSSTHRVSPLLFQTARDTKLLPVVQLRNGVIVLMGDAGPLRYKSPNFEKGWALVVFVCFSAVLRTCEAHARLPGCRSNSAGRLATTRGGPGISDTARRS